ncbi:MAG: diguanylate cyclase domain-containing protein [Terracidiphilus sp.]
MKRVVPLFAMLCLCVSGAWAQPSAQISTLLAAASLTNGQASRHSPVSFEATVTYYRPYERNLFVQDGDSAIYLHPAAMYRLIPGDRVRVRGTMHESFRPYVENAQIALLAHGSLPTPRHPDYSQMLHAETDCKLVALRALVQSADLVHNSQMPVSTVELQLLVDGSPLDASIDGDDPRSPADLLDAEVEITGVQSGRFDNKMQQTGILLHVQSLNQVRILQRAGVDPWSIIVTPMDRILTGYRVRDMSDRLHVHGTITYYQPGVALVLQSGSKSLWITTNSWDVLRVGEIADAIGFPTVENGFLTLSRSEVRDSSVAAPVNPSLFTWRDLALGGNEGNSHVFDLVSIEGTVVTEVRQATQDEYILESNGHLFSAILRHPGTASRAPLAPMKEIPLGSRVRVTGICMLVDANPFKGEVPFNILMRDVDDIMVVARPPWLNVRHLILIVGLLLGVVIAIGIRSWALERRVRQKTAALAYLEQRRSRILEDINNSRPLCEIIENITEVASFKLHGAACWCEIADGASLGMRPPTITSQRIIQQEIPGRSGAVLGTIFAAIHRLNKPCAEESEALILGADLATLAIETSHLYSDLVHRSEFDLLTDVPNRFSLEKHLDAMISEARRSAGIFGFIFIDLDRFKLVNDQYGHQSGDLYLQEAALRMKGQLRPGDTLARLGGDEFAVVVAAVHSRCDIEEIANRLEHCFDELFAVGGHIVRGAASVGFALYPDDAVSADSLMRAADAAMYAVKQSRKSGRPASPGATSPDMASKRCA